MRVVALDIETAPAIAFSFTGFKAHIGPDQIIEHPRMIAFSYQWEGEKKVGFYSEYHDGRAAMLEAIHAILDDADVVMGYNSKAFDMPWITGELIVEGFAPPAPYQQIDLYQILKGKTRFFSRKLDYASLRLLDDRKVTHTGFLMWRDCLIGNEDEKRKAWTLMKRYAIKDTALLFPLYERIKPWITTGHPNRALYDSVPDGCPKCASSDYQKRGYHYTGTGKYQRYQCKADGCGNWWHDPHRIETTLSRA